jgi:anti-sigma factor RsiW
MVSPYVDGESTSADRRALELHLSACPACTARVADTRTLREALHPALLAPADGVDFSDFARKVLARVTPAKEPLGSRLTVWWNEVWTYHRMVILTSVTTAALALGIGGPLIWTLARQSARAEVLIHSLQADNPNLTPVVMQADDGATMVMFVDHPEEASPEGEPEEGEMRLPVQDPEKPAGGEL